MPKSSSLKCYESFRLTQLQISHNTYHDYSTDNNKSQISGQNLAISKAHYNQEESSLFSSDNNARTFFGNLFWEHFKMFPERIGTASRWSHRINGTFSVYPMKKNTLQAMLGDTLLTGKSIPNTTEKFLHKINTVHLQKLTDPAHFLLTDPDLTRLSTTTITWTGITGARIKHKIKTTHLHNIQCSFTLY
jgi:hypothetical protein